MNTEKTRDEQFSGDRIREDREREEKHRNAGCDEIYPDNTSCKFVKKVRDKEGHLDEVRCLFNPDEPHFCGYPCPQIKGDVK